MAKKETTKTVLERVYNVPLRKEYMKAPNWKRTPKAVKALREFIGKHMKSENVIIGKYANQLLWKNGIKNPPHHIKVNAVKDDKGKVAVELVELPGKAKREAVKLKESEKKKDEKEKSDEKEKKEAPKKEVKEAQFEEVIEEVKKEKEEKGKEVLKEEIKEFQKEQKIHPKQHAQKKMPEQRFQESHPTAPRSQ